METLGKGSVLEMRMIHRFMLCLVALSFVFLAGCSKKKTVTLKPKVLSIEEFKEKFPTLPELEARITNTTNHSYSHLHGNQIAYHSADKKAYLWYPGNSRIVVGEWKVKHGSRYRSIQVKTTKGLMNRKFAAPLICYRYGKNTVDPTMTKLVGEWSCGSFTLSQDLTVEDHIGDIFKLSQRLFVPFVLTGEGEMKTEAFLAACQNCETIEY